MRYSAIGVFNDGSFFNPTLFNFEDDVTKNIMQHGLRNAKRKEFFKQHKYVIIYYKRTYFMVFEESHPMFNIANITDIMPYKYRQEVKLIINRLIVEFGGLNSSLSK